MLITLRSGNPLPVPVERAVPEAYSISSPVDEGLMFSICARSISCTMSAVSSNNTSRRDAVTTISCSTVVCCVFVSAESESIGQRLHASVRVSIDMCLILFLLSVNDRTHTVFKSSLLKNSCAVPCWTILVNLERVQYVFVLWFQFRK